MPDLPHGLGALRSLPDRRDRIYPYALGAPVASDLRADAPYIWDQGQLGSCVPHGVLRAANHSERVQGLTVVSGSALFVYFNGRVLEGTVDYDSGLYVRDGIKALNSWGVADRWAWPYDVSRFTEAPPQHAYDQGSGEKIVDYARITMGTPGIHDALAHRQAVVFGFSVHPSFFDTPSDGIMPHPQPDEPVAGGHCTAIVGYRPQDDRFIVANSWGTGWGDEGYFYMSVSDFLADSFSDDIWVVRRVV